MATYLQLRQQLAARIHMDETLSDQATILNRFINTAIETVAEETEWDFLVERGTSFSVGSTTTTVTFSSIASTFIAPLSLYMIDTAYSPSKRWQLEEQKIPFSDPAFNTLRGVDPNDATRRKKPTRYWVEWNAQAPVLILDPYPDATYTGVLYYRATLPDLSADADTNYFTNNFRGMILDQASKEGFTFKGKDELVELYQREYERKLDSALDRQDIRSRTARMVLDPKVFKNTRVSP